MSTNPRRRGRMIRCKCCTTRACAERPRGTPRRAITNEGTNQ